MFDLLDAKRVRRDHLYSSRSSSASSSPAPEVDPELAAALNAQLAALYGPVTEDAKVDNNETENNKSDDGVDGSQNRERASAPGDTESVEEEGFRFRLFATPRTTSTGPQVGKADEKDLKTEGGDGTSQPRPPPIQDKVIRIILDDDDDEELGDGALVNPHRPDQGYYFATSATGDKKRGFEQMAVSGEQVRAYLGLRYWGWEKPWRVRVLKPPTVKTKVVSHDKGEEDVKPKEVRLQQKQQEQQEKGTVIFEGVDADVDSKRKTKTKPGKKRRIILRVRKRKAEEAKEKRERDRAEKEKQAKEREELDREKRTKRNREKKVKKKAREKANKAATVGVATTTRSDTGVDVDVNRDIDTQVAE